MSLGANPGSGTSTGLTLGAKRDGTTFANVYVAFLGVYAGDVTAAGNWSAFCTWVNGTYGVSLA